MANRKITIKQKAEIQVNIELINKYMNKYFFTTLQNLKYDKSELVSEYLEHFTVNLNKIKPEEELDFLN